MRPDAQADAPADPAPTAPTETPQDADPDTLEDALVRIAYLVMGVLTRIGAENDMSLTQLRVLGILRDRRGRITELATYLGLDKSTMSGLVDRAERRGLLARGKNPVDGRGVDVFATPAGLELARRLREEFRRALAPSTNRLTPEQRDQLTQLLECLLEESQRAPAQPGRAH